MTTDKKLSELTAASNIASADFLITQGGASKKASLSTMMMQGDSGSGGRLGLVPAPGAGDASASKFMAADGTWKVVPAASASQMEAGSSSSVFVTPSIQHRHPSAAKCWAYVTVSGGSPTLQTSYNITSITDAGVGRLNITIGTDFSSANWSAQATVAGPTGSASFTSQESSTVAKAAGSVELLAVQSGTLTDPINYSFAGFGDQ